MERICACGKPFKGDRLKCRACRSPERVCACGKSFKSSMLKCSSCRETHRICACGTAFKGTKTRCWSCRGANRVCACGKSYQGTNGQCWDCRKQERSCNTCGALFVGTKSECSPCRAQVHQCACGTIYKGESLKCTTCFRSDLSAEVREARSRSANNARRARKFGSGGGGSVTARQYAEIRASGPCVYCGATAATVDHVIPLARGGAEHVDNLVPACEWCNKSKGSRLLDDWWPDLVANAIRVSPKVAAAYGQSATLHRALPRPAVTP